MAESLMASDAVFRDTVTEIDALFSQQQRWSLRELLAGRDAGVSLDRPEIAHPAIFTVQAGLTRCLVQRGIRPAAVIGHSAGEVAAAVCAGALSLPDAVRLVAAHSELIAAVHPGAMLHVPLDARTLASLIAAADAGLELAAINSDQASVIAGTPDAIAAFDAALKAEGIDTRLLSIRIPFHTRAVDPHLDAFRRRIADIRPGMPAMAFYSSLRGGLAEDGDFSAGYWVRHIRETVQFPSAARRMFEDGVDRCIEVSPHPALLQHLTSIAGERGAAIAFDATLQRGIPEPVWPAVAAAASVTPLDPPAIAQALRDSAAEVLGSAFSLDDVLQSKWTEIGCTSLQITQLMAKLSARLGKPLSVTLPYRHPTPASLIDALAAAPAHHAAIVRTTPRRDETVTIVGMACRLPGGANSPDTLWDMLASGVDPVTEIPPDRWQADAFYDTDRNAKGRSITRWGSFIGGQDLREFDAKHFRMTPREASALDPQQRLLREVTWEALENAGFSSVGLKGK